MHEENCPLVRHFLRSHALAPTEIVLDLDATDDPVHGEQEGRFFHGFYSHCFYLPLYVFCGESLLGATLHTADVAPGKRAVEELERIELADPGASTRPGGAVSLYRWATDRTTRQRRGTRGRIRPGEKTVLT